LEQNTKYLSPFHILNHFTEDFEKLATIKKKAVLEARPSDNQFLVINTSSYSKQEVISSNDKKTIYFTKKINFFFYLGNNWSSSEKTDYIYRFKNRIRINNSLVNVKVITK
jgi:hypothetical protein